MVRLFVFALQLGLVAAAHAQADTALFESATLGPTGAAEFTVPSTNVTSAVFTGVRFELTEPVQTTQVGGHFLSGVGGTFFGAIIELENASDFPNSSDLESDDVLGHTELTFPILSDEVFGDLELTLQPGFYALVFGSGLFGTLGDGAATRNNVDIENPEYIGLQPKGSNQWGVLINPIFRNHRYVIEGNVIPEPSTIVLSMIAFTLPLIWQR